MLSLIVGDPHLQVQRLEDGRLFIEKLIVLSSTHRRMVITGDLFHSFALIRSEVLSLWTDFFIRVKCPVTVLVGNHDYAAQDGGTHALEPLRHLDGVTVIDSPTNAGGIYYLPFIRDVKTFEAECQKIPAGKLLFCHQSFNGAKFGNGYYDPHGADPVCVSHLKGVISGHIHNAQQVFNIWYPGSPFQQNFGEAGDDKFVYSIEITPEGYSVAERHDLQLPRYIEIKADSVSQLLENLPEPNALNSYKFIARGSPQEIIAFRQDERFKIFRSKVRRVVDALVPERGEVNLLGQDGTTKTEKREAYIKSRKWRTPVARLCLAANSLLAEQ